MRSAKTALRLGLLPLLIGCATSSGAENSADGWITLRDAGANPIVLHFRRELMLERIPPTMPVTVTADNRFILFVNGRRMASGPSTGTISRWRYSTVDLAPALKAGHNVVAAVVWNFGESAPLAQQSVATGFRLLGDSISTGAPGWRVKIDAGHSAVKGNQLAPQYYVASTPEIIDANETDWDWMAAAAAHGEWQDAVPAPAAAARTLGADPLPPQTFAPASAGQVVRTTLPGGEKFPARPVTVPAHARAKLLIRRDAMISAYPELAVSGGKGATIKVTWTEALYDSEGQRGDRDLVADRKVTGFFDTFIADGAPRTFATLWWRTWRFAEIDVATQDTPLTLAGFRVNETGYPFARVGQFSSNDGDLQRIWDIGWRTLRVDAHETFMDSSYWEQLQYAGDTRLEMLISYAVSGDPRLAQQAIDAFAESSEDGGLMQGAYPSRGNNVISTFSLAWIGMLSDWSWEQPDAAPVVRHLPRMRTILAWFGKLQTAQGLLGANPHWNFIDWAGQRWDDRSVFPSYGREGGSCLMTVMWLGALQQAGALEAAHGDPALARADEDEAARAAAAIRRHCWDARRGLFADNPDLNVFSQHMNALAVLYDVATREEAPGVLERITLPGRGIDAPPGMFASTYYFAWYLLRAFEHAGLSGRYLALLRTWRELLTLNYTTWPEARVHPRSDTHAWSAHPTADLLRVVAGIRSAGAGYSRIGIEPALGGLTSLDATAATPRGPVSVRYRIAGGMLTAQIEKPRSLPGEFRWNGTAYPLAAVHTRLRLDAAPRAGSAQPAHRQQPVVPDTFVDEGFEGRLGHRAAEIDGQVPR
jgi:alpha-L-rhamnosidase